MDASETGWEYGSVNMAYWTLNKDSLHIPASRNLSPPVVQNITVTVWSWVNDTNLCGSIIYSLSITSQLIHWVLQRWRSSKPKHSLRTSQRLSTSTLSLALCSWTTLQPQWGVMGHRSLLLSLQLGTIPPPRSSARYLPTVSNVASLISSMRWT